MSPISINHLALVIADETPRLLNVIFGMLKDDGFSFLQMSEEQLGAYVESHQLSGGDMAVLDGLGMLRHVRQYWDRETLVAVVMAREMGNGKTMLRDALRPNRIELSG